MRIIAVLFMLCGVALAGGAIFYASEHFRNVEAMLADRDVTGPEVVKVIAAKRPLKMGDRLRFDDAFDTLKFVTWPKEAVPEGAFISENEVYGDTRDQIRVVTRAIEPGELLLKSKVTGFGENLRIATQVREGMRAYTIPINAVTGGGGLISPGDRVDILYIRKTNNQMSSHILMQDVLVVATDQSTDTERNRASVARTATVEVNPNQAQVLTLARETGTLSLLLRGTVEQSTESTQIESVDLSQLPGAPVVEVAPVIEPEPEPEIEVIDEGYRVRVRKGADVESIEFKD